jgi:hypothetical protein
MKCIVCQKKNAYWMIFNKGDEQRAFCSYICQNKYGSVGFHNIVNIQDFTKYPIPYINFKDYINKPQSFSVKDDYELNMMDEEQRNNYKQRLQDEYEYTLESESSYSSTDED